MTDTLTKATELLDKQKFQEALDLLNTISPTTAVIKTRAARALSGLGDWQSAFDLFSEVLTHEPDCHEALSGRGVLFYLSGHLDHAKKDYDKAIELAPEKGRYRGLRGMLYGQAGAVTEALEDLEQAYELGDSDPAYLLARAQLHLSAQQLPEAKRILELAEQFNADEAALSSLEGALSVMEGDHEEGLASYRYAVEAAPQVVDYWMNMLVLTSKVSRGRLLDESLRALDEHPDHPEIIQVAVGAYIEKGQVKEAFQIMRDAIGRNPDSPILHFQMGMGLAHMEKFEQAVASFDKALELEPRFPRALDARGNCLERLGKKKEAELDFKESHRIRKEDAERMGMPVPEEPGSGGSASTESAEDDPVAKESTGG